MLALSQLTPWSVFPVKNNLAEKYLPLHVRTFIYLLCSCFFFPFFFVKNATVGIRCVLF